LIGFDTSNFLVTIPYGEVMRPIEWHESRMRWLAFFVGLILAYVIHLSSFTTLRWSFPVLVCGDFFIPWWSTYLERQGIRFQGLWESSKCIMSGFMMEIRVNLRFTLVMSNSRTICRPCTMPYVRWYLPQA